MGDEKSLMEGLQRLNDLISENVNRLKGVVKDNSELSLNLITDNDLVEQKIRKCGVLQEVNAKCSELTRLYQSILKAYLNQSSSIENIYNLLKK